MTCCGRRRAGLARDRALLKAALSSRWVQIEIGICLQKEEQIGNKIPLPVLYRFKTRRMIPELEFLGISYAARWYSLITPLGTFLR